MPVEGPQYPVGLILGGKRCVVVGGGAVAARKVRGLLHCGADVVAVAPAVGDEIAGLAEQGTVTLRRRPWEPADLDGAWLVVTATGDTAVDAAVHAEAERRLLWCNAADDPSHCSFTLPAVARQGPVVVTVATGGRSPALAVWLRDQIAAGLGPEYEVLADLLAEAREEVRGCGRSTEDLDWPAAIDSGMLELIRRGEVPLAKERLQAWLSSSSE